jgi:prolipoprotein diacylglyceryltransferase
VLLYTAGRVWIEALRIDPVNTVGGVRLNVWTSIVVGLGALIYLVWSARTRPGREVLEPTDDSSGDSEPGDSEPTPADTGRSG